MLSSAGRSGVRGAGLGGETARKTRVTAVGNCAERESLDVPERKRGRRRERGCVPASTQQEKRSAERARPELFLQKRAGWESCLRAAWL